MSIRKSLATIGFAAVALTAFDSPPAQAVAAPPTASPQTDGEDGTARIAGPFVLTSSIPGTAPYRGVFRLGLSGQQGERSLEWARDHASATSFPAVGTTGPIVMDGQCVTTRGFTLAPCFSPDPAQRFGLRDAGDGALEITQSAAGGERTRILGFDDLFRQWTVTEEPGAKTITTVLGAELSPTSDPVPDDAVLPPIARAVWDEITASDGGFSVRVRSERDAAVVAFRGATAVATATPVVAEPGTYDLTLPASVVGAPLVIRTTAVNGQTSDSTMTVPGADDTALPSPDVTWTTRLESGDFRVRGFAPTGATVMADSPSGGVASTTSSAGRFELTVPGRYASQDLEYRSSLGSEMSAASTHRLEAGGDGHLPTEAERPRVAGVVHYLGSEMFIEGTVSYDPRQWATTRVTAYGADGRPIASDTDFRGAFALPVPVTAEGDRITVVTSIGDVESEPTELVLERTENTASADFPLDVVSPAADETTESARPTFAGTGIPGSRVAIADDAARRTTLCSTTIEADGAWSCTPTGDLADGPRTVRVTEPAFWSSVAPTSTTTSFVVETAPGVVAPFVVTSPAPGAVVRDRRPTFTGTGQDGATIVIRGTTRVVATTTVTDGRWSASAEVDLADGDYALTATQRRGSEGDGEVPVTFRIDAATTPIAVVSPATDATVTSSTPTFTGTGQHGATVVIRGTSRVVATTTVEDGRWAVPSDVVLADGAYALTATQTTTDGRVSRAPVTFTVDAATTPVEVVSPASGATVTTATPTFTGTGQDGATIVVRGSTRTLGTAIVRGGAWELTSGIALGDGEYRLFVDQTTRSGTSTVEHRLVVRA
jgi:formylmethanofuran dehydrogenase subunit C